jgi:DNA-directed RNA polymerase I subunit RPA12
METIDLSVYADNLFCKECGSLLNLGVGDGDEIMCTGCANTTDTSVLSKINFTTKVTVRTESVLSQMNKKQTKKAENEFAIVEEECPQCKHPEMRYYTMQLRSADEGQTVFYECPKCLFKFSVNN